LTPHWFIPHLRFRLVHTRVAGHTRIALRSVSTSRTPSAHHTVTPDRFEHHATTLTFRCTGCPFLAARPTDAATLRRFWFTPLGLPVYTCWTTVHWTAHWCTTRFTAARTPTPARCAPSRRHRSYGLRAARTKFSFRISASRTTRTFCLGHAAPILPLVLPATPVCLPPDAVPLWTCWVYMVLVAHGHCHLGHRCAVHGSCTFSRYATCMYRLYLATYSCLFCYYL